MPDEPVVDAAPIEEPKAEPDKAAEPTELEKAATHIAELEAERERLLQKVATEDGRTRRSLSAEDYAESFRREMRRANDLTSRQIEVLLRANVPEQDRPVVEQALAKLQLQTQTEAAEDAAVQEANELYRDLIDEAQDAKLDLAISPELQAVRNIWNQGWSKEGKPANLSHMRAAVREARRIRREAKPKGPEPEPAKKSALPSPKATGTPAAKSEAQRYAAYAAGESDEHEWARKYIAKLMKE